MEVDDWLRPALRGGAEEEEAEKIADENLLATDTLI